MTNTVFRIQNRPKHYPYDAGGDDGFDRRSAIRSPSWPPASRYGGRLGFSAVGAWCRQQLNVDVGTLVAGPGRTPLRDRARC